MRRGDQSEASDPLPLSFIYIRAKVDTNVSGAVCTSPVGFFTKVCSSGHLTKTALRCHDCSECAKARLTKIRMDIQARIKENGLLSTKGILWTLGTDLEYTDDNYRKLRRWFQLFCKRIRRVTPLIVLFRVYERGSKGGRLHVHFVSNYSAFLDHGLVLRTWRTTTGINGANVNFSPPPSSNHRAGGAIRYLVKYLTKDSSLRANYYFGRPLWYKWRKLKEEVDYDVNNEPIRSKTIHMKPNYYFKKTVVYKLKKVSEYKQGNGAYIKLKSNIKEDVVVQNTKIWRNVPLLCKYPITELESCLKPIVIKALEFIPDKVSKLYETFGKKIADNVFSEYLALIDEHR